MRFGYMSRDKQLAMVQIIFTAGFGLMISGTQLITSEPGWGVAFVILSIIAVLFSLWKFDKLH